MVFSVCMLQKNQDLKNVNNKNNKRSGVSFLEPTVVSLSRLTTTTKAVQTEIQNIHCRLVSKVVLLAK